MEGNRPSFYWFRGGAATLLALLVIAVGLPNVGRVIIDGPTAHVEGRVRDSLIIIGAALVPLVFILLLGRRWKLFEVIGWVFLVVLFAAEVFH